VAHGNLLAPSSSAALVLSFTAVLLLSQTNLKSPVRPGDLQTWQRLAQVLPQRFQSQEPGAAGLAWSQESPFSRTAPNTLFPACPVPHQLKTAVLGTSGMS